MCSGERVHSVLDGKMTLRSEGQLRAHVVQSWNSSSELPSPMLDTGVEERSSVDSRGNAPRTGVRPARIL